MVNDKGTLAETYIFGNEFGLKRSQIKKRLSKYTTKVLDGESSITESECESNHDSDSDKSEILSHQPVQDRNWIDTFLEKRKKMHQAKKLPVRLHK